MNDKVKAWIDKAEGDYRTAGRELRTAERPNFDAVCYHCQQCVEKLLKGALLARGVEPPHVHDLVYLSKRLRDAGATWRFDEHELYFLSQSAVVFRYPGETASSDEGREAMEICERLRGELLRMLSEEAE